MNYKTLNFYTKAFYLIALFFIGINFFALKNFDLDFLEPLVYSFQIIITQLAIIMVSLIHVLTRFSLKNIHFVLFLGASTPFALSMLA